MPFSRSSLSMCNNPSLKSISFLGISHCRMFLLENKMPFYFRLSSLFPSLTVEVCLSLLCPSVSVSSSTCHCLPLSVLPSPLPPLSLSLSLSHSCQCHFCDLQLVFSLQLHSHKSDHWQVWPLHEQDRQDMWTQGSPRRQLGELRARWTRERDKYYQREGWRISGFLGTQWNGGDWHGKLTEGLTALTPKLKPHPVQASCSSAFPFPDRWLRSLSPLAGASLTLRPLPASLSFARLA